MAEYRLELVPVEQIEKHWDAWAPWLAHVPRGELYSVADVRTWLLDGRRQLWAVLYAVADLSVEVAAVVVTSVEDFPQRRVGRVCELAGIDMVHWLHLMPELERAFRDAGCEVVEVYGRRGWERVLDGYSLYASVLRKELN